MPVVNGLLPRVKATTIRVDRKEVGKKSDGGGIDKGGCPHRKKAAMH